MNKNIVEVAMLKPDYLGFIFWEPSKRYFSSTTIPEIPHSIQKVGVFVDAKLNFILQKIKEYELLLVQLHGNESPSFCLKLKEHAKHIKIIKVLSIGNDFNFNELLPFEKVCDFYLFDTKGKLPGGNGYIFDWKLLADYPSSKPFFLSGGIGLDELASIKSFLKVPVAKYCHAIDVNSKFEIEPGLKNIEQLEKLINTK